MLIFSPALPAQDKPPEQLEDLLREVVLNFFVDVHRLPGESLIIKSYSLADETPSAAVLHVGYEWIPVPDQFLIGAVIVDANNQPLPEFTASHAALTTPSGEAEIVLSPQAGVGRVTSDGVVIVVLNRYDGGIIDLKRFRYARFWEGGQAQAADQPPERETRKTEAEPEPGPDELAEMEQRKASQDKEPEPEPGPDELAEMEQRKAAQEEEPEQRQPQEYTVNPRPIGTTASAFKTGEEEKGGADNKFQPQRLGELKQEEDKSDKKAVAEAEAVIHQPRTERLEVQPRTMVAIKGMATSNLFTSAGVAAWSNGQDSLPFNGAGDDSRGFVRALAQATLSDGRAYQNVLETHPQWINGGKITGDYQIQIAKNAEHFVAGLGFLQGATASDGVRFVVIFRDVELDQVFSILSEQIVYQSGIVEKRIPLPPQIRGHKGELALGVFALGTAAKDWAVWVNPRIE